MEKKYVVVVNVNGEDVCFVREVNENGNRYADFSPLYTKAMCFDTEMAATLRCAWLDLFGYKARVEIFYRVNIPKMI